MRRKHAFRPSSLDELETRLVPSAIHLPRQILPPDVVTSLFKSDHHGHHTKWGNFLRSIGKDFNSSIIKPIHHAYQNSRHPAAQAPARPAWAHQSQAPLGSTTLTNSASPAAH